MVGSQTVGVGRVVTIWLHFLQNLASLFLHFLKPYANFRARRKRAPIDVLEVPANPHGSNDALGAPWVAMGAIDCMESAVLLR